MPEDFDAKQLLSEIENYLKKIILNNSCGTKK